MQDILFGLREDLKTFLVPKQYFAWQTLLLLSLFSLIVATLLEAINGDPVNGAAAVNGENPFAVDLLTTFSWIFFTLAVWWALAETKPIKLGDFSLSPWITGIVLCLFLFRPWTDTRFRLAFSCWPLLSTGIKALPHFINWELKASLPKPKIQKMLFTVLLVNLLLTSWILFYFRVQDWVSNYPTLLARDLNNSAFVYDFGQDRPERSSQGGPLLENIADGIALELDGQPWYQAERWLYTRKERLEKIAGQAFEELDASGEEPFWRVNIQEPREFGEGYLLDMKATWAGPMQAQTGLYAEKTCKIVPNDRPRAVPRRENEPEPTTQVATVDCGEPARDQWELPPL